MLCCFLNDDDTSDELTLTWDSATKEHDEVDVKDDEVDVEGSNLGENLNLAVK